MPDESSGQQEPRSAEVRRQLREVIAQMLEVLGKDLPAFPEREAKKRFVAAAEVSARISDADLAELKSRLQEVAKTVAPAVLAELGSSEIWIDLPGALPEKGQRSLEPNERVTRALGQVADELRSLLQGAGLPDSELRYKTPTWFIDGAYMPGLIEKYWQLLGTLREVESAERTVERQGVKKDLAKRWDEA